MAFKNTATRETGEAERGAHTPATPWATLSVRTCLTRQPHRAQGAIRAAAPHARMADATAAHVSGPTHMHTHTHARTRTPGPKAPRHSGLPRTGTSIKAHQQQQQVPSTCGRNETVAQHCCLPVGGSGGAWVWRVLRHVHVCVKEDTCWTSGDMSIYCGRVGARRVCARGSVL